MPADRPTITVNPRDIKNRRAFLRRSFVGKLLIAHWAGAPWNDKKPKAFLHALQVEYIARREREKLVHGGSRLGKSVIGGCFGIDAATRPFRIIHVVAARYDHVAKEWQYIYAGLQKLFKGHRRVIPDLRFTAKQNYYDFGLRTAWETTGTGISTDADDGAALLGTASTDMILGEGSHIAVSIWEKRCVRALDGATMTNARLAEIEEMGRSSIATTPKGFEGCSASEWERVMKSTKRRPEKLHYGACPWGRTVWIREASVLENPDYQKEVYDARSQSMDRRAFEEQYGGKMTFASGRVLHAFDEERHLIRMPTEDEIRRMRLGMGIDTGAFTAFELAGLNPDKKMFALGEAYTEKLSLRKTLEVVAEMLVDTLGPVYDTTDYREILGYIDIWSIDPASQVKVDLIEEWDVSLMGPNTADTKSVLQTLNMMNQWLESDRLFIVEEACPYLVDQAKKYVWKIVKAASKNVSAPTIREPLKEYDHCIDALRFGLVMLEPCGPLEVPVAPRNFKEEYERMQRESLTAPLRRQLDEARRWE